MGIEQKKISVDALEIGMYVSGLDRPWLETPFLFQGYDKGRITPQTHKSLALALSSTLAHQLLVFCVAMDLPPRCVFGASSEIT